MRGGSSRDEGGNHQSGQRAGAQERISGVHAASIAAAYAGENPAGYRLGVGGTGLSWSSAELQLLQAASPLAGEIRLSSRNATRSMGPRPRLTRRSAAM